MYTSKIAINDNCREKVYSTFLSRTPWRDYKKDDGTYKMIQDFNSSELAVIMSRPTLFRKPFAVADVYRIDKDAFYISSNSIGDILKAIDTVSHLFDENFIDKVLYIKKN